MKRIEEDDIDDNSDDSKRIIYPILIGLGCVFVLIWSINHISNGCTNFSDAFTWCSGTTGSVVITK